MKKTNVFRKICTALLAAVMAFGLVGCGNKAKGGGKLCATKTEFTMILRRTRQST